MKRLIAIMGLLCLSGCITYSLEELRHVEPVRTPFHKALFAYYKEFALKEEQQYDWVDAMAFADKGLQAAYGNTVLPENPAHWNIDAATLPIMQTGYDSLMEVLGSGVRETHPGIAARAQYYFDCWVEQQEEGWQEEDIRYCREGFKDTMDTLLRLRAPDGMEAEEMMPAPAPAKPQLHAYIIFFEQNRPAMTEDGKQTIEELLELVEDGRSYRFVVKNQDSDTTWNKERAHRIYDALVDGGMHPDDIHSFDFGEPAQGEGQETAFEANQQVEIFISE